jgi:aldose 1-epimerase
MTTSLSRGLLRPFCFILVASFAALAPAVAAPDAVTNAPTATNAATATAPAPFSADTVTSRYFGRNGRMPVTLYTLTNQAGMSVSIMNYGATITSIRVPDRNGKFDDVVLGFDKFSPYLKMKDYFGATVGRYANRIARGKFTLDKMTYQLAINDPPNALHGGLRGFDKRMWNAEPITPSETPAVRFTYLSKDGEEGYPGNLFVSVTFSLNEQNELRITYHATTDKPTVLNLSNHAYYNLGGAGSGTILNELVTLHADKFTPVDDTLIPTGEIQDVAGTPYDFRQPTVINAHIKELKGKPQGYDFNYVLNKGFFSDWGLAAVVQDPATGRRLEISTDQPGIQFYTGNFLTGSYIGRERKRYPQYGALCLETQHYPDSPNHDNFPTTILRPGQDFQSSTVYAFSVDK